MNMLRRREPEMTQHANALASDRPPLPAHMSRRPAAPSGETFALPAQRLNAGERALVAQVEDEIGKFVRDNRDQLGLDQAIADIDLNKPPAAAVDLVNLLHTTFETYLASLNHVRASAIEETARLAYQIDVTKTEIAGSKDAIAEHHLQFMTRLRNHLVAIADLRRTITVQRAAVTSAPADSSEVAAAPDPTPQSPPEAPPHD
jgi:hypothetical protein